MASPWLVSGTVLVMLAAGATTGGAQQPEIAGPRLVLGARLEADLAGGEHHDYALRLDDAQLVRLVVEQQGIDVVVRVIDPDGHQLQEVDSPNGTDGPEPVALLTEAAGDYRIRIAALDTAAAAGRYTIALTELRATLPSDPRRLEAEGQFARGTQLKLGATAEAFHNALVPLDSAAVGWRAVGDSAELAKTLVEIGDAWKRLGDDEPAIAVLDSALTLYRQLGDAEGELSALNQLGMVYGNKEDDAQSIAHFEAAIALARRVGNRAMEASASTNVGNRYYASGRMAEAREALTRAVTIARELRDPKREAPALNNLARFLDVVGEPGEALTCFRQALELTRAIPDRYGEMAVLGNMGSVYSALGADQRAITSRLEALAIARQLGDLRSQALILNNLAVSHGYLHRPDSALANYREAVRLAHETRFRSVEAQATDGVASVLRDHLHDPAGAVAEYQHAIALWREVGDQLGEATTLGELGRAYVDLGDHAKAWEALRQARQMMHQNHQLTYEVKTLSVMAELAETEGELDSAYALRREGATGFEQLRSRTLAGSLRTALSATAETFTEDFIDLLQRLHARNPEAGHDREAFEMAEGSRARTLLDDLAAAHVDIQEHVDSQLVAAERAAGARVDSLAGRLGSSLRAGPDSARALRAALDRAVTDAEDLRDRLRAENPRYAALTEKALRLTEVQQLLDSTSALLLYSGGDRQGHGWLVTSTSLTSFVLPPDSVIAGLGRRYLGLLTERNRRIEGETAVAWRARMTRAHRELPAAAGALSEAILGPVAGSLGNRRLLIMPSGVLHVLPLAALPAPRGAGRPGQSLIARGEVVIIPSMSTVAVMRELRRERQQPAGTLAVMADPVFSPSDPRLPRGRAPLASPVATAASGDEDAGKLALRAAGVDADGPLPRLPASREEAQAILSLVPPSQRLEALGLHASRALALGSELSRYRILHFATHGFVNLDYPDLSGIALSTVDDRGEPTDGYLRVHQIYGLHLLADLVVLSACQTALGREVKGEGLIGLSRAFMYAGAGAVVASLWKVDDRATSEMMRLFYRQMLGPSRLRPAAALRAAQIEMSHHPRWSDPYYWAAFTIQGEWQ